MAQKVKKVESKDQYLKLDYLLSEGTSLPRAVDMVGMPLVKAIEHLKSKQLQRDIEPVVLNMVADKALESGMLALVALSQSLVPQVRLGAAQELTKLGLALKKMMLELESPAPNDREKSKEEGSHWRFSAVAG